MNNHLLVLLFLIPILLCLFTASSVKAAELPVAKPAQVGFSAERLDRLSQGMQAYVEQKKVAGLVALILRDGKVVYEKGVLALTEDRRNNFYLQGPQKCYSGGGGLLSTARDYATFLLMLQQGGELNDVRLLSPKSIELMTVNHVGDLYGSGGFGLGFWITDRLGRNGQLGTVGSFGWGGAYYTIYWVDPVEKMVVVLMTQMGPPAPDCDLHSEFRSLVYQAIIKSYE